MKNKISVNFDREKLKTNTTLSKLIDSHQTQASKSKNFSEF